MKYCFIIEHALHGSWDDLLPSDPDNAADGLESLVAGNGIQYDRATNDHYKLLNQKSNTNLFRWNLSFRFKPWNQNSKGFLLLLLLLYLLLL